METKELIYVKAIVDKYNDKDIREKVNELFRIGKLIDSLNELINEEKQLIIDTKNKINRINKQLMQQQKILGVINKVKIKNNFTDVTFIHHKLLDKLYYKFINDDNYASIANKTKQLKEAKNISDKEREAIIKIDKIFTEVNDVKNVIGENKINIAKLRAKQMLIAMDIIENNKLFIFGSLTIDSITRGHYDIIFKKYEREKCCIIKTIKKFE